MRILAVILAATLLLSAVTALDLPPPPPTPGSGTTGTTPDDPPPISNTQPTPDEPPTIPETPPQTTNSQRTPTEPTKEAAPQNNLAGQANNPGTQPQENEPVVVAARQEDGFPLFTVLLVALIFVGLAGAGYWWWTHRMPHAPQSPFDKKRLHMAQDYVYVLRGRQVSDGVIRQQLRSAGWPDDYITEALRR